MSWSLSLYDKKIYDLDSIFKSNFQWKFFFPNIMWMFATRCFYFHFINISCMTMLWNSSVLLLIKSFPDIISFFTLSHLTQASGHWHGTEHYYGYGLHGDDGIADIPLQCTTDPPGKFSRSWVSFNGYWK